MSNAGSIITFIIISFSLSLILIWKKDTLPPGVKRPLALLALVMISMSFFLMIYSFISNPM
ncbi:hypothetical protein [Paenibacillus silviterrae]|uniref:hypothetical protein n=1 Tax=Paenibacillus silviterrae TaxID=3242194 RepID=UPI00254363CB|nr:hypothetical protein [Paenibacillus chinjuensis]